MSVKADKFKELAAKRTAKAITAINLIGNCANKGNYDYTDEQVNAIIEALQKEIAQLRQDLLQEQIKLAEAVSGEKINLNLADSVEQITDFDSINTAFKDQEKANPDGTTTNPQSVSANTNPGY